jgi:hypothetical protein
VADHDEKTPRDSAGFFRAGLDIDNKAVAGRSVSPSGGGFDGI